MSLLMRYNSNFNALAETDVCLVLYWCDAHAYETYAKYMYHVVVTAVITLIHRSDKQPDAWKNTLHIIGHPRRVESKLIAGNFKATK